MFHIYLDDLETFVVWLIFGWNIADLQNTSPTHWHIDAQTFNTPSQMAEARGKGGQLSPQFFKWGSKNTYCLTPTFNVYKACFTAFGSLSYTVNTIHSVHYAHIKLSLAYRATVAKRTTCDQKFGSKLHFVSNQNELQFCHKMIHFAHKISKIFRGWYRQTPVCHLPNLTPIFKYLPQSMYTMHTNLLGMCEPLTGNKTWGHNV